MKLTKVEDNNFINKTIREIIINSWWVYIILFCGLFVFNQAIKKRNNDIVKLESRLYNLSSEKIFMENEKDDLTLRLHSQSDPEWVELILRKELGVVPDGFIKVHFTKNSAQ